MSPVQSPSLSTPSSTPLNTTGPPDTHDEGCIWRREEEEAPAYDMLVSSGILDFQFLDIRSHEHRLFLGHPLQITILMPPKRYRQ